MATSWNRTAINPTPPVAPAGNAFLGFYAPGQTIGSTWLSWTFGSWMEDTPGPPLANSLGMVGTILVEAGTDIPDPLLNPEADWMSLEPMVWEYNLTLPATSYWAYQAYNGRGGRKHESMRRVPTGWADAYHVMCWNILGTALPLGWSDNLWMSGHSSTLVHGAPAE